MPGNKVKRFNKYLLIVLLLMICAGLPGAEGKENKFFHLTILHSNDFHGANIEILPYWAALIAGS